MEIFENIFCYVFLIGLCVLFAVAMLAGAAVLVVIAINFIKERLKDGK